MQFHTRFIDLLLRFRLLIFSIVVVITGFLGYSIMSLNVDNDPAHSVPDDFPQKVNFSAMREKFNSPYQMLFMAELTEGTLTEKLLQLEQWREELSALTTADSFGEQKPCFENVLSVSSIKVPVKGGMLGVKSKPLLDTTLTEEKLLSRFKENESIVSRFVSEDQTIFLMILYSNPEVDRQNGITEAVKTVRGYRNQGFEQTYITGSTATTWYITEGTRRDLSRLLPVAVLFSMIILFALFRKISFVLAPLIIIAIALIWSFGLMSLLNFNFSVVASVIPLILFPVGMADSIHVLKSFVNYHREGNDFRDSFALSYEELLRPILLTSVTTFFGFASFAFSPLEWTRTFGMFTGLAVMLALLLTIILLPLLVSGDAKKSEKSTKEISIMPMKFMNWFIFRSPGAVIALLLVLFFSGIFLPKLGFENNPISFFRNDHPIGISDSIIGEEFGGSRFFDLLIESDSTIADSLRWSEITEIVDMIEEKPEIGSVTSLLPIINRISEITKGEALANSSISMLLGGKGMFGKSFGSVVKAGITDDRKAVKLSLTCKNIPQFSYTELADEFKDEIEKRYPHYRVTAAGQALMIDSGVDLVINTQVSSLVLTFITVALILVLLYRSFSIGLFTTLPILVATLFVAAIMASLGVTINSITVVIMNCSVGIGIDYAIHFTSGFLRAHNHYEGTREAIMHAIHDKGTVIIFNTVAVGVGFLILDVSSFPPVADLGRFIFLSMVVSSIFALVFLPLLLQWIKPLKEKKMNNNC